MTLIFCHITADRSLQVHKLTRSSTLFSAPVLASRRWTFTDIFSQNGPFGGGVISAVASGRRWWNKRRASKYSAVNISAQVKTEGAEQSAAVWNSFRFWAQIWITYKICLLVCSEMKRIAFRPGDTVLKSRPFAFVIIASHRWYSTIIKPYFRCYPSHPPLDIWLPGGTAQWGNERLY